MSDTKWTKGPWRAVATGYSDEVNEIFAGSESVADAEGANAHLIAAAPELYDALDMFIQAVENNIICVRPSDREIIMTILEQGKNAASKARGEV